MTATLTARKPDFGGYATRAGVECSDGRTIKSGAFKHQDKMRVPLVWSHNSKSPDHILGHAILEHREDGVYTYAYFNDTPQGENARKLVQHEDITKLSIHARNLKQQGMHVLHGDIKEVSLVMSGANPGAFIENINFEHSDDGDSIVGEAIIYTTDSELIHTDLGENVPDLEHAEETVEDVYNTLTDKQKNVVAALIADAMSHDDDDDSEENSEEEESEENSEEENSEENSEEEVQHADKDTTVGDVLKSLTPIQTSVVQLLIGQAIEESKSASHSDNNDADNQLNHQEGTTMGRNVFEQNGNTADRKTLSHSDLESIAQSAIKSNGSYREAFNDFIEHADYGIENIDLLFPDARTLTNTPELIARQAEWVPKVLGATKHSPFAKIKSIVADLTAEEARAKGYIKGTMKKEEVIKLLRRTTGPTTVYKKQKLDRDDIIDITDLDVVAWLKWEIRFMLNEEIARAILIGDGRSSLNPDKIKDPEGAIDGNGIRSIANDDDLYAHKVDLAANVSSDVLIDEVTRARTHYRGSGSPTFYTTDKVLTDLLLLKDKMGRRLYGTDAELASALRVKEIVSVEVLEETPTVLGIMVNLVDFTVGANKGGELSFFEDFDIDFNQNKYLLETRISGALTKPKSAIVIRREIGTLAEATAPSFDGSTDTITIPTSTGVNYLINDEIVTGTYGPITEATEVVAAPADGYYLEANSTKSWTYTP